MKNIKLAILTLGIIAGFGLAAMPSPVGAIDVFKNCPAGSTDPICASSKTDTLPDFLKNVVNTLLYVLGAVAVVTIIVAGIRYTTSHGDPGAVKTAKDTLMYAIIGLVVAMLSYAIVNYFANR